MNPLTLEWIEKAEGDLATTERELRARNRPNYDAACFHAQQVAEKYLKAVLQEWGKNIPRIHNLVDLNAICTEIDGTFVVIETELKGLDGFAVHTRYPGQRAVKEDARAALKTTRSIRLFIRKKLGLS